MVILTGLTGQDDQAGEAMMADGGHDPKRLQAAMTRAAPPDLALSFRPMFGGIMGYAEGRAFASLSDVGLALKLAGADQAALLAVEGAAMLRYEPDAPVSKSYVVVPEAMLDDVAALRPWIARSAASAMAAPPKSRAAKPRAAKPRATGPAAGRRSGRA